MQRLVFVCLILGLAGCQGDPISSESSQAALFGPVAMRVHPIFTQMKDWTGDNKPDGIEALIELQDQFGDPTKAAGSVIFELYTYRPYDPERRGERVCNPWVGYLETIDEQRGRWNRTSRTYSFQLAYDGISEDRNYVLTAEFQLAGGGRFFDRTILEGKRPDRAAERTTAGPSTQPAIDRQQPVAPAGTPERSQNEPTTPPRTPPRSSEP